MDNRYVQQFKKGSLEMILLKLGKYRMEQSDKQTHRRIFKLRVH